MTEFSRMSTGLGEECGVFGAYDMDGHDVAPSIYYGLFALQHRGQESCGNRSDRYERTEKGPFKKRARTW